MASEAGAAFKSGGLIVISGTRLELASDVTIDGDGDGARDGKTLLLRGHQGRVTSVAASPDGRQPVSVGVECRVRFWDAGAGYTGTD